MTQFSRRALYELVWSQPMQIAAKSVGVSDVALSKACRKASIPVPERGYWARKKANKSVVTPSLAPRFPGASDQVEVGASQSSWGDPRWKEKLLSEPVPPTPSFDETLASVEERVRQLVGKVSCPRQITKPHRFIAILLERDEQRRIDYTTKGYTWRAPIFGVPLEKRRLKLLNAVFVAAENVGCRPFMRTAEFADDRQTSIRVGEVTVRFSVEVRKEKGTAREPHEGTALRLIVGSRVWEDREGEALEDVLSDVLVEALVSAEREYRERRISSHEWLLKRRVEVAAEIEKEKIEAEQKARDLKAKQEKERIGRLLEQADNLNRANTIRSYVASVRERAGEFVLGPADLELWASWALAQAEAIDPVRNGTIAQAVGELAGTHDQV